MTGLASSVFLRVCPATAFSASPRTFFAFCLPASQRQNPPQMKRLKQPVTSSPTHRPCSPPFSHSFAFGTLLQEETRVSMQPRDLGVTCCASVTSICRPTKVASDYIDHNEKRCRSCLENTSVPKYDCAQ